MGNINFNIIKDVNLNKTVNLNIDKNVDVNVNINDLLATAEADAEAFGEFALAEVDGFTYVNQGEPEIRFIPHPGTVNVVGFTTLIEQEPDGPIDDDLPDIVTASFNANPGETLPTVQGVLGTGNLTPLTGTPAPGTIIPDANFTANDKRFVQIEPGVPGPRPNTRVGLYELDGGWEVNFGQRTLDLDSDGVFETDNLILTVPDGTLYTILFDDENQDGVFDDAKEYQFVDIIDGLEFRFGADVYELTSYEQIGGETLIAEQGNWDFIATSDFGRTDVVPGTSEAFAYAESTSALDLQDTNEVTFFIEGTFGEGANILSEGSFSGTFTEDSFPTTGSGSILDYNLTFSDSTDDPVFSTICVDIPFTDISICGTVDHEEEDVFDSWSADIIIINPPDDDNGSGEVEQVGELLFDFTRLEGSDEINFVEGELIFDSLGEPLEIISASITLLQDDMLGSIGDLVFLDGNGDGINNDGLGGLSGVEVELRGPVSKTTTTNSEGLYLFDNLPPGTYNVTFDISDIDFGGSNVGAFTQGPDSQVMLSEFRQIATADNINLAPGEENLNIDAGVEIL